MSDERPLRPTEFLVNRDLDRDLFKGWSFDFYNLSSDVEKKLTKAITDFGGIVSKYAKYTLTDSQSFLPSKENKPLYCYTFIIDKIRDNDYRDIKMYRISDDETDFSSSDSDVSQVVHVSSESEENDKIGSDTNCNKNDNVRKRGAPNLSVSEALKENFKAKKSKFTLIRNQEKKSFNNKNKENYDSDVEVIEETPKASCSKDLNICTAEKSNSKSNTTTAQKNSIPVSNKKIKSLVDKSSANKNRKINKLEFPEQDVIILDEDSESQVEIEEIPAYKKYWWEQHPIPVEEACKRSKCFLEPVPHEDHPVPGRDFSDTEKKAMIKYLITNNLIIKAKSQKVWDDMTDKGYLTHRSVESLRNCIRRTILPRIREFGLPEEILNQFLVVADVKLEKGRKKTLKV